MKKTVLALIDPKVHFEPYLNEYLLAKQEDAKARNYAFILIPFVIVPRILMELDYATRKSLLLPFTIITVLVIIFVLYKSFGHLKARAKILKPVHKYLFELGKPHGFSKVKMIQAFELFMKSIT